MDSRQLKMTDERLQ